MITSIVVDDEEQGRNTLCKLIRKYCADLQVMAVAESASAALDAIERHHPDLVFLDVEMQETSGLELLGSFEHPSFDVIFVTAHERYAVPALRHAAFDFLLKPVASLDLITAVKRYRQRQRPPLATTKQRDTQSDTRAPQQLALPTQEGFVFVDINEISHCKAVSNYTEVHMLTGRTITSSRTLLEFERLLEGSGFVRVHQSGLINLRYVRKFRRGKGRGGIIVMHDGSEIDVAQRRRDHFLEQFARL